MDNEKFLYQKLIKSDRDYVLFEWYLINRKERNGVHFHGVQDVNGQTGFENSYGFRTHGIEIHSKKSIYPDQTPRTNCFVTQGDCYCDGTSMGAREMLGDINPEGPDDKRIWFVLESFYKDVFEEKVGTDQ